MATINHVIYLANNSCCLQKQMKIEQQVEKLYTFDWVVLEEVHHGKDGTDTITNITHRTAQITY